MARTTSKLLDTGDRLPDFELKLLDGKTLNIPDGLGKRYTVVLFYRFSG